MTAARRGTTPGRARRPRAKTADRLAIDGGTPARSTYLPYGRHSILPEDIEAVNDVLRGDWLTTGPQIPVFEKALAAATGTTDAVAVANGTAALELLYQAHGLGPGDEVVTTPLTFAATSNAALYVGAKPVFADIDPSTLQLSPEAAAEGITRKTRAIVVVHYGGTVADMRPFVDLAEDHDLLLLEDAAHALGAAYRGQAAGSFGDGGTFSFHPVKHITTGEGGAVSTDDPDLARRLRMLRHHGIDVQTGQRHGATAGHRYDMRMLGRNYRLTDFQAALGTSQLRRLGPNLAARRRMAKRYRSALKGLFTIPEVPTGSEPAYHLYPVQLDASWTRPRDDVFRALRAENIGVNVHYVPVHLHPYYRETLGTGPGLCPEAEAAYGKLLSLPMFHAMTEPDLDDVVRACEKVAAHYRS